MSTDSGRKAPASELPVGLESHKRTPSFTAETVPAGLLKDHSTKEGVWGLIHVEHGSLRYFVTDPARIAAERLVTPESGPAIVEPAILHRVEPAADVRFHVEFLRAPHEPVPLCRQEELAYRENRERSDDDG